MSGTPITPEMLAKAKMLQRPSSGESKDQKKARETAAFRGMVLQTAGPIAGGLCSSPEALKMLQSEEGPQELARVATYLAQEVVLCCHSLPHWKDLQDQPEQSEEDLTSRQARALATAIHRQR